MRTGAIFARGSCRALKWMALFGVMFALGAGQAVAQKPNKPVLTAVEGVTATSVKLTWTVPGGGPAIASFVTQTSTTGGADFSATDTASDGTAVADSGPTTRDATITGVTAGTRTTYRVGAVNTAGVTWSNVRHFTTENAPSAPTIGATPTIGDGQVTLTWTPGAVDASSGAPDYYEYNYKPGTAGDTFGTTGADARRWTRVAGGSGARRQIVSGLTNGTSYVFGVRAVNRGGPTPAATLVAAIPSGKPGAPTDLTVTLGTPSSGRVDVTLAWMEPENNGGSPIDYYEYEIDGFRAWTPTTDSSTFFVITGLGADMAAGYTYRVRAVNANGAGPAVGSDGTTEGGGTTTTPAGGTAGRITEIKLVGDSVSEKRIGNVTRYHVPEGAHDISLEVAVEWSVAEIVHEVGYGEVQWINFAIQSPMGQLPSWLSTIDGNGDVSFQEVDGALSVSIGVRTPYSWEVPQSQRDNPRETDRHEKSNRARLLIHEDDHEAENDAFSIALVSSADVDIDATGAPRGLEHDVVVIEDNEEQTLTVRKTNSNPVYEGDEPGPAYRITASPPRRELDLEVELDMLDLAGATVSSAGISLGDSSVTLTPAANSTIVNVNLPESDGNRDDDEYELQASVKLYSLRSGGFNTIPVASHAITVLDRHKLPDVKVSPNTGTVMEGGKVELTVEINRNPSNTTVSSREKLEYTQEEVTVMLTGGAGSTAGTSDYSIMPNPVTFPERERGSYTASMTVEVEAMTDDVLDDMEMLVLDAMVAGSVAANGTDKKPQAGVSTLTIEEGTAKLVLGEDAGGGRGRGLRREERRDG